MNENVFSIKGKVAIITGAGGVLGSSIARSFVAAGAKVVAVNRQQQSVDKIVSELHSLGGEAIGIAGDVLDIDNLERIAEDVVGRWGKIDVLLNIAGGNLPGATLSEDQSFFDMALSDWEKVTDLNINGTVYPCFVFGKVMARQGTGVIINISSMASYAAITRVPGYSLSKTGINNFTQWLATEVALKFSDKIRVNAVAPGFFVGHQNRNVLLKPDGTLTERSQRVIAKTPMKRFGYIEELNGVMQFLCSDAASFITGVVLPVDGGFSAFSGI